MCIHVPSCFTKDSSWAASSRKVSYKEPLCDEVEIEERTEENGILITCIGGSLGQTACRLTSGPKLRHV